MKFKTELHCHTAEISPCSNEPGAITAEKYINHGYTTLVVTNHFSDGVADSFIKKGSWEANVDAFYDAVELVREAAGDRMHVLCGMELRMERDPNDYLVFGATREAIAAIPDLFEMSIRDAHSRLNEIGAIVVQAHPFRYGMKIVSPANLDGYEIANGHPGQLSHNSIAEMWAKQYTEKKIIFTSGSDNHYKDQEPNAGILTDSPITSNDELLAVLRGGDYEIIRPNLDQPE